MWRTAYANVFVRVTYAETEYGVKSLQSAGQILSGVLTPLDSEQLIVKTRSGPRYVVGCRSKMDKEKLTAGIRVVLDMTTLTIIRVLVMWIEGYNSCSNPATRFLL